MMYEWQGACRVVVMFYLSGAGGGVKLKILIILNITGWTCIVTRVVTKNTCMSSLSWYLGVSRDRNHNHCNIVDPRSKALVTTKLVSKSTV